MFATFLATTSQKFSTSFCSFWQSCLASFPLTCLLPCPAPITRRWKLWSCNHYLAPAVTSLVRCRLSMLYDWVTESCLCQGNTFYLYWSAFLCKELLPARLTHSKSLVRSYSNITNSSNGLIKLSTDSGVVAKNLKHWKCWCNVIVGFPCIPCSSFTSSSKIATWKSMGIGNAIHRSGPKARAISWAAIKRKHLPVPRAIHTSALLRRWADVTANTTTSVSTVRVETFVFPSFAASSKCRVILVSVFSCAPRASTETTLDWLQSISVRCVQIICLFQSMDATTAVARKENTSTLFSSMR